LFWGLTGFLGGWELATRVAAFLRCDMRFLGVADAGQFVVSLWLDVVLWWASILIA
jgi:hypothetical protein